MIKPLPHEVAETLNTYPKPIRSKLMALRELVYTTANDVDCVELLDECLKWGEIAYVIPGGSTVRLAWKSRYPDQYAVYFHCKTKLVSTFRELYGEKFTFEGNRAIVFNATDTVPTNELKHCLLLALTYHKRKNLPLLGA